MVAVVVRVSKKGKVLPINSRCVRRECIREALLALLTIIPQGKVVTYGELSRLLGVNPRFIALLLKENPYPIAVPCHRVVKSSGGVGGYTLEGRRADAFKAKLLRFEGVSMCHSTSSIKVCRGSIAKLYDFLNDSTNGRKSG